ncbi:RNA-directed DNA polymerase, eukaryota, reverse transcriptase zinc-binding domain protein [Tanacetum coccineum]
MLGGLYLYYKECGLLVGSNNEDYFEKEGDDISVAESVGDIPVKELMEEQHSKQHDLIEIDDNGINTIDTDPFDLADLIARKCQQEEATKESVLHDSMSMKNEAPQKRVGISMLEQLEETIKVDMALGFNMDGCEATLEKINAEMGDVNETKLVCVDLWTLRQVWGNIQFDFASTSARGCWIQNGAKIMFIAVYAPQSLAGKIDLWSLLSRLISSWDGQVIVMGDFNEWASKMSKLDRFLVSEGFYDTVPLLIGIVLEKGIPNHRLTLLKESVVDYGPTLFRFFHSWLDIEKLQNLKQVIRSWVICKRVEDNRLWKEHKSRSSLIEVKVDQNIATREDLIGRVASMKIVGDIEWKEASDLAQIAKIKWVVEGDKNTIFFHGTLKKKRRQNAIKGVLKNGI